jgi:hypothetical protein
MLNRFIKWMKWLNTLATEGKTLRDDIQVFIFEARKLAVQVSKTPGDLNARGQTLVNAADDIRKRVEKVLGKSDG